MRHFLIGAARADGSGHGHDPDTVPLIDGPAAAEGEPTSDKTLEPKAAITTAEQFLGADAEVSFDWHTFAFPE